MHMGTVIVARPDWWLPAGIAVALILLLLVWSYARAETGSGLRGMAVALKLLGIAALLACLLEPLWSGQRAKSGANFFALLADNSQGMRIKDRDQPQSRAQWLKATLTAEKIPWLDPLEERFQLRRYLFDARLHPTKDFGDLDFEGRATGLAAALRSLAERFRNQPLAGVLLFTDGNATDLTEWPADMPPLPPIYPVLVGGDGPLKDLALGTPVVSQAAFEDAPVTVQAEVHTSGYANQSLVAQVLAVPRLSTTAAPIPTQNTTNTTAAVGLAAHETGARVVAEQSLKPLRDGETLRFRFQLKPDQNGVLFYRLRVAAKDELALLERPEAATEATLANNQRVVVVDRGGGPYRVLYVSGRPNWEYKFLRRALDEDDQIEMSALIRIAKREPKFDFRGRAGESSNPLFRGFSNQSAEDIERYDQPVLVRLNTRDDRELQGGFPKTAEALHVYHAVIVDDLEAEFFTADQLLLLQRFVSERGGGFVMLGGAESFQRGKYLRTPVGDMLPVYLDQVPETRPARDLKLSLTREGLLQPWARLRGQEEDEQERLRQMPGFHVLNRVRAVKPGASVIATASESSGTEHPAIVVQRFGHGRTAAVTLGDVWRWGLRDEAKHRDMDKAWRQLVRWLVSDTPAKITLQSTVGHSDPPGSVLLQARARDGAFQPLENATVKLAVHVMAVGGNSQAGLAPNAPPDAPHAAPPPNAAGPIHLAADPATEPGNYQATFVPRASGGYLAEAIVLDDAGVEVGRAQAGWASDPTADEFRSLRPNRALLETIARRTGGEVIAADRLEAFARSLDRRQAPIMESWTIPLWHRPAVLAFALLCLTLEWGLRRWRGLA
jgi:uncharacterized membrane protein